MSDNEHLVRIDRKLNAVLLGTQAVLRHLLERRESDEMSKLHDDLKALADDIGAAADRVISAKADSEASLADVITQFEATRDRLKLAADEAAPANGGVAIDQTNVGQVLTGTGSTLTDNTGGSTSA